MTPKTEPQNATETKKSLKKKITLILLVVFFIGISFFAWKKYYSLSKENPAPKEDPHKDHDHEKKPKIPKAKEIDVAAKELLFLWEKSFLIQRAITTEEFVEEFQLELKNRFEQTIDIFKETGFQLELAISLAFPLQKIDPDFCAKYINYCEHMDRFLLLNWKTMENINVFIVQTVESARNQGLPIRYEQFIKNFRSFQRTLILKEAVYSRLYDYFFFLDQMAERWYFNGQQIMVAPASLQANFNQITADLYYAIHLAEESRKAGLAVLPENIDTQIHFKETESYLKNKSERNLRTKGKIKSQQPVFIYDYIEVFRNICWDHRNFKLGKEQLKNDLFSIAIGFYGSFMKSYDDPYAVLKFKEWDPYLLDPVTYWNQKKSYLLAEKQLVERQWWIWSRYHAARLVLRFCGLGIAEYEVSYNTLKKYNHWQEKRQKKLYNWYQKQKKIIRLANDLHSLLGQFAVPKEKKPTFKNNLNMKTFQEKLKEMEELKKKK